MVIAIFRSRLRSENAEEFHELADRMMKLAEAMPGFLAYKVFIAEDDERCSIVEFESHEELLAWRNLAEHREAQRIGRERFYEAYTLHVTDPVRLMELSFSACRAFCIVDTITHSSPVSAFVLRTNNPTRAGIA